MNIKHVELLQKLEQFQLDSPEASLPFSARLARENNWSSDYARRVIAEYKRFAFLAIAAGHPVSPSEDVDQAWHLHLTYSENYWKVFCPEILGHPFHHHPTRGGQSESEKFNDWYARTLKSYETFFKDLPPADIWPSPQRRQKERHDFIRVDREQSWVVPKPRIRLKPAHALWAGLLCVATFCSGAMFAQGVNIFDWRGPEFLAFYILFFPICFVIAFGVRWKLRVPAAGDSPRAIELDGYAAAYLNGGKVLTVNTAIANLVTQKALFVDTKNRRFYISQKTKPSSNSELENVIYSAAGSTNNTIGDLRSAAKPIVSLIAEDLKKRGLVVPDAAAQKAISIPLTITFAAIAVGGIKILVGISRDKPVGFLVVLCVLSAIATLFTLARRPLRSRYGDEVLECLQDRHARLRRVSRNASNISSAEFAMVIGLFGMDALAGPELDTVRTALDIARWKRQQLLQFVRRGRWKLWGRQVDAEELVGVVEENAAAVVTC